MNNSVSVIIPTFNSEQTIIDCLSSVTTQTKNLLEVIVVDNNSQDKTIEVAKEQKGPIKVISQNKNLGFSKANNIGVAASHGEYLMFLNPDTKVTSGAIDKMLEFYQIHTDAGVVAPKLIDGQGQVQPSVRKLPTIWRAVKEYYFHFKNEYQAYVPETKDDYVVVESVVGAAMLIKKSVYQKVGGFDNRFFLYYEDLDLCKKILQSGLKIYYLPQVMIKHLEGHSAKSNPKSLSLMKASAKAYHGTLYYYLLTLILRLRVLF